MIWPELTISIRGAFHLLRVWQPLTPRVKWQLEAVGLKFVLIAVAVLCHQWPKLHSFLYKSTRSGCTLENCSLWQMQRHEIWTGLGAKGEFWKVDSRIPHIYIKKSARQKYVRHALSWLSIYIYSINFFPSRKMMKMLFCQAHKADPRHTLVCVVGNDLWSLIPSYDRGLYFNDLVPETQNLHMCFNPGRSQCHDTVPNLGIAVAVNSITNPLPVPVHMTLLASPYFFCYIYT